MEAVIKIHNNITTGVPKDFGVSINLSDSGQRTQYKTGAVRETGVKKGRCDLLPLSVIHKRENSDVLKHIQSFLDKKNSQHLWDAIESFCSEINWDVFTMYLEISHHFEDGAKKYSDNNWKRGLPVHCYIDSGIRHYFKWCRGDIDERHDRAFAWNMLCAIWTVEVKPELIDVEGDIEYMEGKIDDVS